MCLTAKGWLVPVEGNHYIYTFIDSLDLLCFHYFSIIELIAFESILLLLFIDIITMPISNVKEVQIQNLICSTPRVIFIVGNTGINAFAVPCTIKPTNGLFPEDLIVQEKKNEYPRVSIINPKKFI